MKMRRKEQLFSAFLCTLLPKPWSGLCIEMQLYREAAERSKFLPKPEGGEILAIWIMIAMPWKIMSGNANRISCGLWKGKEFQAPGNSLCESPG